MDLFYKPALQRPDECHALEDNYMNCLFQKALKDRVLTNMCNMDSILWFHLECPKAASRFDNPIEFKRRVGQFLAEQKTFAENQFDLPEENKRMRSEYSGIFYPEDIKERKELRQYKELFDKHDPFLRPEDEDDLENEELDPDYDYDVPTDEMEYKDPDWFLTRPIKVSDSLKFAPEEYVASHPKNETYVDRKPVAPREEAAEDAGEAEAGGDEE